MVDRRGKRERNKKRRRFLLERIGKNTHTLTDFPSLSYTHTHIYIYIHTYKKKKNAFVLLEAKNKSKGGGSVGGRHTIKGKKSSAKRKKGKEKTQKETP